MNKPTLKRGSSLLMVLCMMTMLVMVATVTLRNSTYALDLALERVTYFKHSWALEGLMLYALAYAKENYDTWVTDQQEVTINVEKCPTQTKTLYSGNIIIIPQKKMIRAELIKGKNSMGAAVCTLERVTQKDTSRFEIHNWRIEGNVDTKKATS